MGMSIDKEDRYKNACIKYLQKNMECVGYRDYIIERLNKYQKIEQAYSAYLETMNPDTLADLISTII